MAIIKCKMCGGDLELVPDSTVCECEYCGTRQTVPAADDEKKLKLFERANRLRRACEFDKAAGVYESIVADFDTEAEAYWGLVLCKFGIEYVDDPATGKKVPTCHRAGFESVEDDANFEQACENADAVARRVYREEGRAIDALRERILEVSGKEEPYDIFISYKELAEDGERTEDSILAQDIYDALTAKGYRVFFSRITLEDKLGVEYEPYIFAALNSAKVMLLVGMDYENLNAVWVKNEWSRYLALMAQNKEKVLIPCYKDMDPYDLPKEVRKLAAQDMGKVGAMQDLLRGVEKILPLKTTEPAPVSQPAVVSGGPNVAAMLDRGKMALEDSEWLKAKEFFDQALNMDARNAEAYLGLALADLQLCDENGLAMLQAGKKAAEENANYKKFERFAAPERAEKIAALVEAAETEKQKKEAAEQEEKRQQAEARDAAREAFRKELPKLRARIKPVRGMISAGFTCSLLLRLDGSVEFCGSSSEGEGDTSLWKNITQVAGGGIHCAGIRNDGTVAACGSDRNGRCNVQDWKNIVQVAAGGRHTVGLKDDGTVVAVGDTTEGQCDVSGWTDIVQIDVGTAHTVGLKADGTVVATGDNPYGQCDVSEWRDIVEVAAGRYHTYGLRSDGTIVSAGMADFSTARWSDIIQISACDSQVVGLRADGKVEVKSTENVGEPDWDDLVAVSAGIEHVIGLRADGTVCMVGSNKHCQCLHDGVKLFDSIDTLEEERKAAVEKARAESKAKLEKRRANLEQERDALQKELANLKGLFSGKRRREIEERTGVLEKELRYIEKQEKELGI